MNTTHVLESNMAAAQEEFADAALEATTADDVRELAELSIQSRVMLWALKTKHQIDYDLSSTALQSIK